jgi:hypothetical protein
VVIWDFAFSTAIMKKQKRQSLNFEECVDAIALAPFKGPYRPNAIRQRDANFQFLKTNKNG